MKGFCRFLLVTAILAVIIWLASIIIPILFKFLINLVAIAIVLLFIVIGLVVALDF